ncbi:unnamed protein product [Schistosoma curassoni]|uniref:CRAL-TRIO domain-containing protein n=1 Tax=Schistosoma curassoni TaxID=6186 RepID=A0A183JMX4_9TREM|nr:unnamed protein product [Schistosoma curassoni]
MCGIYDTRTFVMDSVATKILAVQSTHTHANIVLCSFDVLRAFFRKFRNPDYMLPCGHILYAHYQDLIREGKRIPTHQPVDKEIHNGLRALDNMSISTGSDDLLGKFANNYHSIHALSEPFTSKLIRPCSEASEDICAQVMSSTRFNDEATSSESIVLTDHSYAS